MMYFRFTLICMVTVLIGVIILRKEAPLANRPAITRNGKGQNEPDIRPYDAEWMKQIWHDAPVSVKGVYSKHTSGGLNDKFKVLNDENHKTLHDVCIQPDPSGEQVTTGGDNGWTHTLNVTKSILVAYNAQRNHTVSLVKPPRNFLNVPWVVKFSTNPIPEKFHYIQSYPAYFLRDGNLCNMWHFRRETFSSLFYTLKATNRLNSTVSNMLYFYRPVYELTAAERAKGAPGGRDPNCFATTLLPLLSVRKDFDSFHKVTDICYRNIVIGQTLYPADKMPDVEIHNYIKRSLGVEKAQCGQRPFILLIGRKKRAVLNMDRLVQVAKDNGFTNTSIVYLEQYSLKEQMRMIHCTDILVGVQGAALDWAAYMRGNDSALLEIAWTSKKFKAYYSWLYNGYLGMRTYSLEINDLQMNWTAYENDKRGSWQPKLTQEDKEQLLKSNDHEVIKYADVVVNELQFGWKLRTIVRGLKL